MEDKREIEAILFDLDGTLVPMDNDEFTKVYFGMLAKKLATHGYVAEELIGAVMKGTGAMLKNDGTKTNEAAFWEVFCKIYGEKAIEDKAIFDEFYRNEFANARVVTKPNEYAMEAVEEARKKARYVVLATNPLFPDIAVWERMSWVGLKPEDFDLITTYENSSATKPNPLYYKEILDKLGVKPENALMIGNDYHEDVETTEAIGMKGYLVTDNAIGQIEGVGLKGSFQDMIKYLKEL